MSTNLLRKGLIYLSAVIGTTNAEADLQACMNCKQLDANAGFMVNYDYCSDKDEQKCIRNYWNYIWKEKCLAETKPGWSINIDTDCGAEEQPSNCPTLFQPSLALYGQEIKDNHKLPENTKCTILMDASLATARITVKESSSNAYAIGVLFPGYKVGQPITIPQGSKKTITIYNGGSRGYLNFEIVLSGAGQLAVSTAALLSIALLA